MLFFKYTLTKWRRNKQSIKNRVTHIDAPGSPGDIHTFTQGHHVPLLYFAWRTASFMNFFEVSKWLKKKKSESFREPLYICNILTVINNSSLCMVYIFLNNKNKHTGI